MKDNKTWLMGFYVGFAVVLVLFFVIFIIRNRKNGAPEYDERQITARNLAYKYAFFILLVYCALCGFLDVTGIKWATLTALLFIGTMASATVFAVICILRDAYEGINERRNTSLVLFGIIGVVNLGTFVMNIVKGVPYFTDGLLNENVTTPGLAVMFLSLTAAQLIKNRMDKKAADDE